MSYHEEHGYLQLLRDVQTLGERRKNRTGIDTISLFGPQISFLLDDYFPLFTTKRVWWKGVAVELDWMLQGSSNIEYLKKHGVGIWDKWARADYLPDLGYLEGELGPVYGVQWRRWAVFEDRSEWEQRAWTQDDEGDFRRLARRDPEAAAETAAALSRRVARAVREHDQIVQIVDKLRHDPTDRRIILSAWNVAEIDKMKLPPCHMMAQFLVDGDDRLTCIVTFRSWDLFIGAPFNVAQYALLTCLLAHVSGRKAHKLIINAGDAHIYVNHLEQVREQCSRQILHAPKIVLDDVSTANIDDFRFDQPKIVGYDPHPALPGEVAQ